MVGTNTLTRWNKRQPISARQLNETVDQVNRIGRGVAAPVQRKPDSKSLASTVRQFKIVSEEDDYLICNAFDGVDSGDVDFKIAKPYLLRRKPFDSELDDPPDARDGLTFVYQDDVNGDPERVATNESSETETQVIVPSYIVGDIIYATKSVKGGTGVVITINEIDEKIEWLDDNRDARAWAKKSE